MCKIFCIYSSGVGPTPLLTISALVYLLGIKRIYTGKRFIISQHRHRGSATKTDYINSARFTADRSREAPLLYFYKI